MASVDRRDVVLGALFSALGLASFGLIPRRAFPKLSEDALNNAIPAQIGPYSYKLVDGLILPPEDELSKKLYDKVVTRIYEAPGMPPIMALFAYGSTQNLTLELHRPDECYPQQGFEISPLMPAKIAFGGRSIPVNLITASRPDRVEQILFWSRIGDNFPTDRTDQSLMVASENFKGRMPDGMLVRLSIIEEDRERATQQMRQFAAMLGNSLPPLGKRILLGQHSSATA